MRQQQEQTKQVKNCWKLPAELIAHTRSNAYLLFKEQDIGSLEVGKFADLVVLDKDYMTVPENEIYYIESELTMVGGRIVYDARSESAK